MEILPTTSVLAIRPISAHLERVGVRNYLQRIGVEENVLADDQARVPMHKLLSMWRHAVSLSGDNDIGLHVAEGSGFDAYGFASMIAKVSPTIGDAFRRVIRYARFVVGMAVYEVVVVGETAALRIVRPRWVPVDRHANELLLALPHLYSTRATARSWRPIEVSFVHERPASTAEHARIFGCPLRFGAAHAEMRFPTYLLEDPLRERDDRTAEILEDLHTRLSATADGKQHEDELILRARLHVFRRLQDGDTSLTGLAASLAMSERSLQRKLAAVRSSHREILDQVRSVLAERLLSDDVGQPTKLCEVAVMLGFSEQTAFQKAFVRWKGTSPARWRRGLAHSAKIEAA